MPVVAPHPRPPGVPAPFPGTIAARAGARGMAARIWFADGFWWFRSSHDGAIREISSVMRRERYRAANMAQALGVGERTFHRLVCDEVGMSVGLWLRMQRAVEFRHRIKCGDSIKSLSYDYGFSHQGEFCMEFKRWYGLSPRAFLESSPVDTVPDRE